MTTKGEFLIRFNTASFLAENAFNKLGLISKKYCVAHQSDFEELAHEEAYIVRPPFHKLGEDKKVVKDSNGRPQIDEAKEAELNLALTAWKKEPFEPSGTFEPVKLLLPKCLLISPAIYDTIQGHVIDIAEEDYFAIIEAEQEKALLKEQAK